MSRIVVFCCSSAFKVVCCFACEDRLVLSCIYSVRSKIGQPLSFLECGATQRVCALCRALHAADPPATRNVRPLSVIMARDAGRIRYHLCARLTSTKCHSVHLSCGPAVFVRVSVEVPHIQRCRQPCVTAAVGAPALQATIVSHTLTSLSEP